MFFGRWLRDHKQYKSISHAHWALDLQVKTDQAMDQRVIVAYLALKRLSARAIHYDLITTLGLDTVTYSTVARYLHNAYCSSSSLGTASIEVQRGLDDSDQAIMSALEENPFASVRQLSRLIYIPSMTVYRRLPQSLESTPRHLRWVLYALSHVQKVPRVELLQQLLLTLRVQGDRARHDVITFDES
jgi:hypothetical protein